METVQLTIFGDLFSFTRPDDGMLCDSCRKLVWHENGDGYCCCMAPGMAHISAKRRKPIGSACGFYERRTA